MKKATALAFDASGVLISSGKPIPRAREALDLLHKRKIPFVILTNAGGRQDKARADLLNKILGTTLLNERNVI